MTANNHLGGNTGNSHLGENTGNSNVGDNNLNANNNLVNNQLRVSDVRNNDDISMTSNDRLYLEIIDKK